MHFVDESFLVPLAVIRVEIRLLARWRRCAILLAALGTATGLAQGAGIIADGGTATTVTTAASGHQTVALATAVGGVSHNTYTTFNVGTAGADLNNNGVNATTIVNQVTGTSASLLQGVLSVTGPTANVILANPNGINVNGASVSNIGHLVLSTGQVSFTDTTVAGQDQRSVILTTTGGTITVGAGGFSGTLINLDLIAKQLAIDGPVSNSYTSTTGGIRAIVGASSATYTSVYSPTDNGHDWLSSSSSPGVSSNSLAVDISALGSLTAGTITLIVNDKGAGVRNLGTLYATAGDVSLSANGDVSVVDGAIMAANTFALTTTGNVTMQGSQISAGSNITVSAVDMSVSDDGTASSTLNAQSGVVTLTLSGGLSNTGSLIQAGSSSGTTTGGDLTVNAGGGISNDSSSANLGILFAANGNVALTAQGDITNENARILSNQSVSLNAGGTINNFIDHTGSNGQVSAYTSSGNTQLFIANTSSGFTVDYGTVTNPNQLAYVAATNGTVTFNAATISNAGGLIESDVGAINLTAQQSFTNAAVFSGQASYARSCWIVCHANAASTVQAYGGTIESGSSLTITAGTSAANIGGNIFALGDITVNAPITYAQSITGYSAITQGQGVKAFFGSSWAQIIATDIGGGFTSDGLLTLSGQGVVDGGSFSGLQGVAAVGGITVLRAPTTTPVQLGQSAGLFAWH